MDPNRLATGVTDESAQLARLKRTRDRLLYVLDMTDKQADSLRQSLYELSVAIEEEQRR